MDKELLISKLRQDLALVKDENSKYVTIIESLVSSKYELFEELSLIVHRYNNKDVARNKIADVVLKLISDFSIDSEKIRCLENKIDALQDNLITDFKKDLPDIKDADYRLFLFSILGFSSSVISLFLKEGKIEAVYNRKRRLKDRIKRLEKGKAERYLKYFR